jgi:hypothetical protein
MQRHRLFAVGALAAILMAACGTNGDDATDEINGVDPVDAPQVTTAAINWHAQSEREGSVEGATAELETTPDQATLSVDTRALNPGHAYTLWFVIINNPAECEDYPEPCAAPDVLDNPDTRSNVAWGDGQVADDEGLATFNATFNTGAVPGGWYEGVDFEDPQAAEIHFTLNDHGPVIDDLRDDMLTTYRGGCTNESLVEAFPDVAHADGTPGPNTCRLWQAAIFQQ